MVMCGKTRDKWGSFLQEKSPTENGVSAEVLILDVLLFKEIARGFSVFYICLNAGFLPCRYTAKNSSKEEIASNLAVVGALGLMSYPTYHRPFQYFK
jgi:hypothetical protein